LTRNYPSDRWHPTLPRYHGAACRSLRRVYAEGVALRRFPLPRVIANVTAPLPPRPAAGALADAHAGAVRGYFQRAVGRHDLAEDLTQEVFLRVVRATDRYEARGRERAWLFTIAHRVLIDHFRRRKASPFSTFTAAPGTRQRAEQTDDVPACAPATQELRVVLEDALLRLPDEDREIFLLAELAGLSYAEIADACATTHAAVRSRVYRARIALRDALAPSSSQPRR